MGGVVSGTSLFCVYYAHVVLFLVVVVVDVGRFVYCRVYNQYTTHTEDNC